MSQKSKEVSEAIALLRKVLGSPAATQQIERSGLATHNFTIEKITSLSINTSIIVKDYQLAKRYKVVFFFGFTRKGRSKSIMIDVGDSYEKAMMINDAWQAYSDYRIKEEKINNDIGI